jgi:probable blue pigment (indigoidine) exporter
MATGVVLAKRWGRPTGMSVIAFTGWQLTAGGIFLLALMLAIDGAPPTLTLTNVTALGYLSLVGTAIAYSLWFAGVARLPAPAVSLLGLLSPAVAVLVGVAANGEHLTAAQAAGLALVLSAVGAGQIAIAPRRRRRSRRLVAVAAGS